MPKKGKKLDNKKIEQHMEAYSETTTAALLDDAFGKWDDRVDPHNSIPFLDRGDHIIIGGRTATELLMEKFNVDFPTLTAANGEPWKDVQRNQAYGHYLKTHGKQYINQMVSSALATGEKVEVFVPDKLTGEIKDQPMALTPRGYEPAGPLAKPKALTGWQRFWNKLGFYKKEKAAVVNYEKETAARQKVQFCNKAARANLCGNYGMAPAYREEMDKFHPEIREDMAKNYPDAHGDPAMLGEANGFKTRRSSFHATMIEVLATKRDKDGRLLYTNEQLFDMNDPKMQKARADAAKEVYDHYKAGDTDWLVDVQHEAADVLTERVNRQARKLDFSKPDLTEQPGYREFAMLSDTAFDQSQDMNSTSKRMDEKYGEGAYWDAAGKVGAWSQPYRRIGISLNVQKRVLNEVSLKEEDMIRGELGTILEGQALRQQIAKTMKENPERKFSDIANLDLVQAASGVQHQTDYDPALMEQSTKLAREHINDPKTFGRQIAGGVLEGRIKLQELSADGGKFEIKDAATAEREMKQEQAKQNPEMGPAV